MELFFILCLIGVVAVFLFSGSRALLGKALGPLIIIVLVLGMCTYSKREMDKEDAEAKEWNKNFQERLRREDEEARKIRIQEEKDRQEKIRKALGDEEYERIYGKSKSEK